MEGFVDLSFQEMTSGRKLPVTASAVGHYGPRLPVWLQGKS